jgi:hypothetical protein
MALRSRFSQAAPVILQHWFLSTFFFAFRIGFFGLRSSEFAAGYAKYIELASVW